MKFKEKSGRLPKQKRGEQKAKSTPFKIKVVDIEDKIEEKKTADLDEDETTADTGPVKKNGYVKKARKPKQMRPNINLLVTEEDDLASFKDDLELDEGDVEGDYENFMEEMAKLEGKKRKIMSSREEGTGEMSEYNLSAHKSTKVEVSGLVSALGEEGGEDVRNLQKKLGKGSKELKLATALEPHQAAKVARGAGYCGVVKEVAVWDAVVHSRRAADTLSFPLNKTDLRLKGLSQDSERFKAETALEQQIAAMLAGSKNVAAEGEEFSEVEKKCLEGLTAREALERKRELAKIRALQTYQEAKFRRQKKIKSKKFRKIERKMKKKEELAELEQLSRIDPEAAAEKLEQIEKTRIEERASLKHRNASKFLQDTAKRAKLTKNKDFTNIVNDQLRKHRDLVTKHGQSQAGEDKDDNSEDTSENINQNIIMNSSSVEEFGTGYRQFWEEEQAKKEASKDNEELEDIFDEAQFHLKQNNKEKLETISGSIRTEPKTKETEEEEAVDEDNPLNNVQMDSLNYETNKNKKPANKKDNKLKEKTKLPNVDPNDFLSMNSKAIGSDLPEIVGYNDLEEDNDDNEQRNIIAEAFADDNVIDEFKKEKKTLLDSKKPKDLDLTLPGWGEWGGGGVMPSKRKRRRFTIKAPPAEKRRDENSGHLILNTDKDSKLRTHQVSNVPFPFTAVSDFEASIRAPVGSTFLPRTAHLKMIKPRISTKAGHVIEPMDRDQLVKRGLVQVPASLS